MNMRELYQTASTDIKNPESESKEKRESGAGMEMDSRRVANCHLWVISFSVCSLLFAVCVGVRVYGAFAFAFANATANASGYRYLGRGCRLSLRLPMPRLRRICKEQRQRETAAFSVSENKTINTAYLLRLLLAAIIKKIKKKRRWR